MVHFQAQPLTIRNNYMDVMHTHVRHLLSAVVYQWHMKPSERPTTCATTASCGWRGLNTVKVASYKHFLSELVASQIWKIATSQGTLSWDYKAIYFWNKNKHSMRGEITNLSGLTYMFEFSLLSTWKLKIFSQNHQFILKLQRLWN